MTTQVTSSLEQELEAQRQWQLLPHHQHLNIFNELIRNEFLPPAVIEASLAQAIRNGIQYVANQIPYYANIMLDHDIDPKAIDDIGKLSLLPVLTKEELQQNQEALQPRDLPPGYQFGGYVFSSGTTGQPSQVAHTLNSLRMFAILKQREQRWFRMNPGGLFAGIRPGNDLPKDEHGESVGRNVTVNLPGWQYVSNFFRTGKFIGFSDMNEVDDQVEWLLKHDPDYLLMQSAQMEHLALGFQGKPKPNNLKGLEAISQQLTADMRHRIEQTFDLPVQQNYGLNEIGIVATRCPEAGRYHVHTEHCLVEIVDETGAPVKPGEQGRLLVTALNNPAMPLIRYDADDMAIASAGPCSCGRTLPTFESLVGRYRRTINLPPETWGYWDALLYELGHMPQELMQPVRRYQLHQFRDCTYELRLEAVAGVSDMLTDRIQAAWKKHGGDTAAPLSILVVEHIKRPPSGKFQNFTSDYAPFPEAAT